MTESTSPSARGAHGDDQTSRTIVVGVDGSASAGHAAQWAAGEAERRGATLMLVHALHLPEATATALDPIVKQHRTEGLTLLDEQAAAARTGHPGVRIETQLSDLDPTQTLTTLGEAAELVVTGSRGRGGFIGMLLGSVNRKLAVHTTCPLVVVRAEPPAEAAGRIVLGVGAKHSAAAIRYAFEAARRQGATLDVIRAYVANVLYTGMAGVGTMYEGHPESDQLDALTGAREAIEPLAAEYADVKLNVSAREGNAVNTLIDAAREADLLVVATHRRRGALPVGAGYVVDGVLAHSPVPVAVIPDR